LSYIVAAHKTPCGHDMSSSCLVFAQRAPCTYGERRTLEAPRAPERGGYFEAAKVDVPIVSHSCVFVAAPPADAKLKVVASTTLNANLRVGMVPKLAVVEICYGYATSMGSGFTPHFCTNPPPCAERPCWSMHDGVYDPLIVANLSQKVVLRIRLRDSDFDSLPIERVEEECAPTCGGGCKVAFRNGSAVCSPALHKCQGKWPGCCADCFHSCPAEQYDLLQCCPSLEYQCPDKSLDPRVTVSVQYRFPCAHGFSGEQCDKDVDFCAGENPCRHSGTCVDGERNFTCLCPSGYAGPTCAEDVDECATRPCLNGGRCIDRVAGFECVCAEGYEGRHCEVQVNECEHGPCQNGGVCVDLSPGYRCICPPAFAGDQCQRAVDFCRQHPCLNGGTCRNVDDGFECDCLPGHVGERCEENVNECAGSPCKNGGVCVDLHDGYECRCQPGTSGDWCEVISDRCFEHPCGDHGVCTSNGDHFACTCDPGYGGRLCREDVDDCDQQPCLNKGTCEDRVAGFHCKCVLGFHGDRCEKRVDMCANQPCLHGGNCTTRDITPGEQPTFDCSCALGYEGRICQRQRLCDTTDCGHGRCTVVRDRVQCLCEPGWSGVQCTEKETVARKQPQAHKHVKHDAAAAAATPTLWFIAVLLSLSLLGGCVAASLPDEPPCQCCLPRTLFFTLLTAFAIAVAWQGRSWYRTGLHTGDTLLVVSAAVTGLSAAWLVEACGPLRELFVDDEDGQRIEAKLPPRWSSSALLLILAGVGASVAGATLAGHTCDFRVCSLETLGPDFALTVFGAVVAAIGLRALDTADITQLRPQFVKSKASVAPELDLQETSFFVQEEDAGGESQPQVSPVRRPEPRPQEYFGTLGPDSQRDLLDPEFPRSVA